MIWDWEWHLFDSDKGDDSSSDEHSHSSDDEEYSSKHHLSDAEADRGRVPESRHTVTFKVIGCKKESRYQETLMWARDAMESGSVVKVELTPEPSNPYDPKAIAFRCLKDGQFHRIGYVVSEILDHVHASLQSDLVTDVSFKWIKYISDWTRSGPGFFAGINVTKLGRWPNAVVRAASTR